MSYELDLCRWQNALGYDLTFTPTEGDPIRVSLEISDIEQLLDLFEGFRDARRAVAEWTAWLEPFVKRSDWSDALPLAWTDCHHYRVTVLVVPGPERKDVQSYRLLIVSLLSDQIVHHRTALPDEFGNPMDELLEEGCRWVRKNTWHD